MLICAQPNSHHQQILHCSWNSWRVPDIAVWLANDRVWLANDWLDLCFWPLKWLIIPWAVLIEIPQHTVGTNFFLVWLLPWLSFCVLFTLRLGLIETCNWLAAFIDVEATDWFVTSIDVEAADWLKEDCGHLLRWLPNCWLMSNCWPHSHFRPVFALSVRCLQES